MRESLVIIPTTKPDYEWGFSAPLSWMFSGLENYITAKYSCELTISDVIENEYFIVEINWVTEIYEALLIIDYIKSYNKNSKILIGGYSAQIHYKKIMNDFLVDYIIRGSNEKSIKLFLEGEDTRSIPNLVTKDFSNPMDYVFSEKDFDSINYSLDWIPQRQKARSFYNTQAMDKFELPMIITSRSGCSCIQDRCSFCIGSQLKFYRENYNSQYPIKMSNQQLIDHLKKIDSKFFSASLQILSSGNEYDLRGHQFDLDVGIEIEGGVSFESLMNIISSFEKNKVHVSLPLSLKGVNEDDVLYNERFKIIKLIKNGYDIRFLAYDKNETTKLFEPYINYDIGNTWANEKFVYKNYINFDRAYQWSKETYDMYGRMGFKKTLKIF